MTEATEQRQPVPDTLRDLRPKLLMRIEENAPQVEAHPERIELALTRVNEAVAFKAENDPRRRVLHPRVEEGRGHVIRGYEDASDPLTELATVKSAVFRMVIVEFIRELVIPDEYVVSITVADLSGLKRYNDDFGHLIADRFLAKYGWAVAELTQNIKAFYRNGVITLALRMQGGGDEFLLITISKEKMGRELFDLVFSESVPHTEKNKGGVPQQEQMQAYYGLAHFGKEDIADLLEAGEVKDADLFERFRQKLAEADNEAEDIKHGLLLEKIENIIDGLKDKVHDATKITESSGVLYRREVLQAIPQIEQLLREFGSLRLTPEGMQAVVDFTMLLGEVRYILQRLEDMPPELIRTDYDGLKPSHLALLKLLSPEEAALWKTPNREQKPKEPHLDRFVSLMKGIRKFIVQ